MSWVRDPLPRWASFPVWNQWITYTGWEEPKIKKAERGSGCTEGWGMVSYNPAKGRWKEGISWDGDRCMLRGDKNDSAGLQHSHCMLACWSGMSSAWRWMCLTQAASLIALLLFSLLQNTGNTMLHADLAITEQAKQKSSNTIQYCFQCWEYLCLIS